MSMGVKDFPQPEEMPEGDDLYGDFTTQDIEATAFFLGKISNRINHIGRQQVGIVNQMLAILDNVTSCLGCTIR